MGILIAEATERQSGVGRNFSIPDLISLQADKDPKTLGHELRVSRLVFNIAKRMGNANLEAEQYASAALFHDIGKLPLTAIIHRPGKLLEDEMVYVRKHPQIGSLLLRDDASLAEVALYHHERFDGAGYPKGLVGREIPEAARITTVADAIDAMLTRPHRDGVGLSIPEIEEELALCSGTMFDPEIAQVGISVLEGMVGRRECCAIRDL